MNEPLKLDATEIPQAVMASNWCTQCYPIKTQATFIYKGNSLCESCFKEKNA